MAQGLGAKAKKIMTNIAEKSDSTENPKGKNSAQNNVGGTPAEQIEAFQKLFGQMTNTLSGDEPDADGLNEALQMMLPGSFESLPSRLCNKKRFHPSIKEGIKVYTKWLGENSYSLSIADRKRHQKVIDIYKDIDHIFTNEKETDSKEEKAANSAKVYEMLTEASTLGTLPESVSEAMDPGIENSDGLDEFDDLNDMCTTS